MHLELTERMVILILDGSKIGIGGLSLIISVSMGIPSPRCILEEMTDSLS